MHSIEVQEPEWTEKLDEFSKTHEGWLVTLEIVSPPMGARREFRQMPLIGVTADTTNGRTISIAVAEPTGEHLTHFVFSPKRVVIEKTDSGADAALEVVGGDGATAILHLRTRRNL
jgi:Family of unknown function (DUF5335)